ncbi:serine/threonine-protein phosphatase 7 long form homolog [Chenopodium quinoa]|uniref:serine/threonine-protein phosphatase 7 long form homolog n=1 Tax=Chenopodium quinoa TaxID=63459 RepID=UPI000B778948|nr:serine/threonine-protein phosphatase 7 long form homolog [Chenopodium quinoa]
MTWDPYSAVLVEAMPEHLLEHRAEWLARTPMICFEVVESHLPDRVLRQFGLQQPIPMPCDTSIRLHGIDRRGKLETNWALEHHQFIELWDQRLESIVDGHLFQGVMDPRDPYMVWYRQITRLFINPTYTPPSTHYHPAYDVISGLAGDMGAMVDALSDALAAVPTRAQVERVRDMGIHSLQRYGHGHLVHPRDDHDSNSFHSQFDFGQSSGGGHTSGSTQAEDYFIHNTAPGHS